MLYISHLILMMTLRSSCYHPSFKGEETESIMSWFTLECSFWSLHGAHDNSFFYECLRFTTKMCTVGSLTVGFCFARMCVLRRLWYFVTLWTVACQVPRSMGFPRQEYWNALPFLPPGDLLDPGIEPASPASPALAGGLFTSSTSWKPSVLCIHSCPWRSRTNTWPRCQCFHHLTVLWCECRLRSHHFEETWRLALHMTSKINILKTPCTVPRT